MSVAYFGMCNSSTGVISGDTLDDNLGDGHLSVWNGTQVFTCPGSGSVTLTGLHIYCRKASGSTDARIGLYTTGGALVIDAEVFTVSGASYSWQGVTGLSTTLTGGTNYVIFCSFYLGSDVDCRGLSGSSGIGKYEQGPDYISALPTTLPTGNANTIVHAFRGTVTTGSSSITVSLFDSLSVSEYNKRVINPLAIHVQEILNIAENRSGAPSGGSNIQPSILVNSLTIADAIVKTVLSPLAIHVSDRLSLNEPTLVIDEISELVKSLSDNVYLRDSVSATLNISRLKVVLNDSLALAEFTKEPISPFVAHLTDAVNIAEVLIPLLNELSKNLVSVLDVIILQESLAVSLRATHAELTLTESLVIREAIVAYLGISSSISDRFRYRWRN